MYGHYLSELKCPSGIADLVLFKLSARWKRHLSLSVVPPRWIFALHALPYRRTFTATELSTLAGVSVARARQALLEFEQAGYCIRNEAQTWTKRRQPELLTTNICAIEAKLGDWSRALRQATRNYDFARESWVLIDSARAGSAIANIDEFRLRNVGLSSISSHGILTTHFRPRKVAPRSALQLWHVNGEIALRLSSKYVRR